MPPKYNYKVIAKKTVGKQIETTVKITRKDEKNMTPEQVESIYDELTDDADEKFEDYKMRVRVLNPKQWFTLKGFSTNNLNLESVDEYFKNKVKDANKFSDFLQMEVTVLRNQ